MARDDITVTKRRLLADMQEKSWLVSMGTGKVDGQAGIVVSVEKGARGFARRMINRRAVRVPVRIREVGPIRLREKKEGASGRALEALREEAARRTR